MSEIIKINKWLPCDLTEDQILNRARTLSERLSEKDQTERDKSNKMKDFGEKLKKLSGEISRLSEAVSTGKEYNSVECEVCKSFVDGTIKTIRCDTGSVIEVRKMTEEEKQLDMSIL